MEAVGNLAQRAMPASDAFSYITGTTLTGDGGLAYSLSWI